MWYFKGKKIKFGNFPDRHHSGEDGPHFISTPPHPFRRLDFFTCDATLQQSCVRHRGPESV